MFCSRHLKKASSRRPLGLVKTHAHAVNFRASSSHAMLQPSATKRRTGRVVLGLVSLGAGDVVRQLSSDDGPFDAHRLALSAAIGGLFLPLRDRISSVATGVVPARSIAGNLKRLGLQVVVVAPASIACFLAAHAVVSPTVCASLDDTAASWTDRACAKLTQDLWPAYTTSTALSVLVLGAFYLPIPFVKQLAVMGSCVSWSSYMSYIAHKPVTTTTSRAAQNVTASDLVDWMLLTPSTTTTLLSTWTK
ncbi:Aste57867_23940 [Aphanomyces stellatus]|uniref:Aste57867_23940 protein n=1 Tax=Aphanomyces stellatus TaxID=120398 RepID=A0A485LQX1_9STRA|nr:hypothetical protein As57867_023867 [Aphanomyces stellatus]VFU00583.1 Aste57867_23940 [Aphanomyces stellatus]